MTRTNWMRAALGAIALGIFAAPQAQAIDTVPLPERPRSPQARKAVPRVKKRAPAVKKKRAVRRTPAGNRAKASRRK